MNREQAFETLSELDDRFIAEAIRYAPADALKPPERIVQVKKRKILAIALAAALILALGAAAYALSGIPRSTGTHRMPKAAEYDTLEKLSDIEKDVGYPVTVPAQFSNGYGFSKLSVDGEAVYGDGNEVLKEYYGVHVTYTKPDEPDIILNLTPVLELEGGGEAPEPAPQVSGDLGQYVTTREMFDKYARQMDRRDGELANKKFMHLMEKLSLMREDYAKLCRNLSENAASYSGKEVLTSFEAYLVDIENMLTDAGVTIGHFGSIGDPVDVQHQRIMGVVATDDPSKNGTVAQKLSEGYEYDGRAIVKEKVNVYKTAGQTPAVTETGFRLSPSQ